MTMAATRAPSVWWVLKLFRFTTSDPRAQSGDAARSTTEDQARRDFVLEMMQEHPEAFQHEQDVQSMMLFYPSRF